MRKVLIGLGLLLSGAGATQLLAAGGSTGKVEPLVAAPLAQGAFDEEGLGTELGIEFNEGPATNMSFQKFVSGAVNRARVSSAQVPTIDGVVPVGPSASNFGFNGLRHKNQRLDVDAGNQFSIEPPDQGFAIGDCVPSDCLSTTTFTVDAINLALSVRRASDGAVVAAASLNNFFAPLFPGSPTHAIDRTKNPGDAGRFGPFISDPKAYYDPETRRWFITSLEIDTNDVTGAFTNKSNLIVAVSTSSDPRGGYRLYKVNATNDGTGPAPNPAHPNCPCFGDQPLIGADKFAFWLSTNEFGLAGGFNGAQIYALDKAALVAGASANVQLISGGPLAEGISYTVQPATIPPGGSYDASHAGTQYFLSALEFFGGVDNRLAIWAATNTSSISGSPAIVLKNDVFETQVYGQPPVAQQPLVTPGQFCDPNPVNQVGSLNLLMPVGCLLGTGDLLGFSVNEHEPLVKTNDDRMQQVVYANGRLWTTLTSVVKTRNGPTRTAGAYFIVNPSVSAAGTPSASVRKQGYIAVNKASVAFPAAGVNSSGKGVVGFSIIGPGILPSAAWAKLDDNPANSLGPVQIAGTPSPAATGKGLLPDDGFTGYQIFDDRAGRWGDYGAAATDSSGNIWTANEYVPTASRTILANWGTFISRVNPN